MTIKGQLNPVTGNPEILDTYGKVVATSIYQAPAILLTQDDELGYIVFSPYFEGVLPSKLIGRALKLDGRK